MNPIYSCRNYLVVLVCLNMLVLTADVADAAEPNLVGLWKFDEGSGTTAYDSAGENDGTLVNNPTWTTGRIGGALSFDGVDDYIDFGTTQFVTERNPFTVSAWTYINDFVPNIYPKLLTLRSSAATPWEITFSNQAEYLGVLIGSGSTWARAKTNTSASELTGAWKHVAVVYSGSNAAEVNSFKVYLNGRVQTLTSAGPFPALGNVNRVGDGDGGTSNNWDGIIDDIRIYDGALDASEISEIFYSSAHMAYDEQCQGPYIKKAPRGFVPDVTHSGDLVIDGTETMIIENVKYLQEGHIYINDQAKLILRNAQLAMARGDVVTVHTYIFVSRNASFEVENSLIFPAPEGQGGLVVVFNSGRVDITDSPTCIHYFDNFKGAQLTMNNSAMVFTIGGLLQVGGGDMRLTDSVIGALALRVPAGAHLDVKGLKSGVHFESWDVHDLIPEADYNLVLENTCILRDDFTGELKHGPYERGWLFFVNPNAHVRIS
ncbi:MAG: LamG domain-containing protein, partial [Planctomycetota bacterium]